MNYVDFRISLHLKKDLQNIVMEHLFNREKNLSTYKVRFIEEFIRNKSRIPPLDFTVPSMEKIWVQLNIAGCYACQLCFHSALIPSSYPILGQPDVLPFSNKMKTVHCLCTLVQTCTNAAKVSPALWEIQRTSIKWEAAWFTPGMAYSFRCLLLPVGWRYALWRIWGHAWDQWIETSAFVAGRGHVCHIFTFHRWWNKAQYGTWLVQIFLTLIFRQAILFFERLNILIWKWVQ